MTDWEIKPGDIRTRAQLRALYGGSPQGGIITSTKSKHICLFTDHGKAQRYGYHDGWLAEGDDKGALFEYTGQGRSGHQSLDSNNGSVLRHTDTQHRLHVFVAVGKVKGSGTATHRYVGEFTVDPDEPYVVRQGPGEDGKLRRTIVFRLRPVGVAPQVTADVIPPADETRAVRVPATTTTSALAKTEQNRTKTSRRSATKATVAQRREAELSEHYEAFLRHHGHDVRRYQIKVKGLSSTLVTDLYDVTDHVLYEAKGSTTRDDVRQAIGQLLDYRRHIPSVKRLAVLLPDAPHEDLRDLMASLNIALTYRDGDHFAGYPVEDAETDAGPA
ncbi:hypothetical protein ABZ611_13245 [Streptomyces sp. NPDC007861]|uniref:hypothetical protein n=1 Tax=Streptomyces sp. NPDC007861 TaxID=3154893 RepID=UPI0033F6A92F